MKLITKISKFDDEPIVWVKLTYDEELELANTVMTILSTRWVDSEYRDIARRIYKRKCEGKDIRGEFVDGLYEKLLYWNEFYSDRDVDAIPIPAIGENEDYIKPISIRDDENGIKNIKTSEKRTEWCRNEVIRAWREMWDIHHKAMMIISDDFACFPGDTKAMIKYQEELAIKFWEAVEESQSKFGISRTQAIKEVSDHVQRGSQYVTDPNPHKITSGSLTIDDTDETLADDDEEDCYIVE